jgi:TctA family transporter
MTGLVDNVVLGLGTALSIGNLFYCMVGVTVGTLLGVLPGIGTLAALALLFAITFHLDPLPGLIMLAGIYYGTTYGGSTASILLNLPGTPSNAVVCLDGYPMTRQGRAGVALLMTTIASFAGVDRVFIVEAIRFARILAAKIRPALFFDEHPMA